MGNYKKIILEPSLMFIDNRNHTQIYEIAGFWSFNGFIVGCFLREPTLNFEKFAKSGTWNLEATVGTWKRIQLWIFREGSYAWVGFELAVESDTAE